MNAAMTSASHCAKALFVLASIAAGSMEVRVSVRRWAEWVEREKAGDWSGRWFKLTLFGLVIVCEFLEWRRWCI